MQTPVQSSPTSPPIQPQAQPQAPAPVAPPNNGQASQQPSGRAGANYDPQILQQIEQHLNTLPPEQKGFLAKYMTPELAVILGVVIGNEAFDYFKQFADPKKELVVQDRKSEKNTAPQPAPKAAHVMQQGQPQTAPSAPSAQPQPKATAPSIMGV